MNRPNSKIHELRESGALPLFFDIPQDWKPLISSQQYQELYAVIENDLTSEGPLFNQVQSYLHDFLMAQLWSFEWMLAVRQGPEDEELEGIWHDDSSRSVAISLSLNSNPEDIQGGQLLMRRNSYSKMLSKNRYCNSHGHAISSSIHTGYYQPQKL